MAETRDDRHVFEAEVYLRDLDPNAVRVELYADGLDGEVPIPREMRRIRERVGAADGYTLSRQRAGDSFDSRLHRPDHSLPRRHGHSPRSRPNPLAVVILVGRKRIRKTGSLLSFLSHSRKASAPKIQGIGLFSSPAGT